MFSSNFSASANKLSVAVVGPPRGGDPISKFGGSIGAIGEGVSFSNGLRIVAGDVTAAVNAMVAFYLSRITTLRTTM